MHISPISNNNLHVQRKQNSPHFGARIDKTLLKQMEGNTGRLKCLSVETVLGKVFMPAALVAKLSLEANKDNKNPLESATIDQVSDLINSEEKNADEKFSIACKKIKLLPEEEQASTIEKILNNADPSAISYNKAKTVYDTLGEKAYENLHLVKDEDDNTIMHSAARNLGDIEAHSSSSKTYLKNSDFVKHFNDLKSINPKLLKELMLTENSYKFIPAYYSDYACRYVIEQYKNEPEMVKKICMHQDIKGDTILHYITNPDTAKAIFNTLNDGDLAYVLSIKNISNRTACMAQNSRPTKQLLADRIKYLATDSDLSIEKSIKLLEANDMDPQVVEFLKLQKAALEEKE